MDKKVSKKNKHTKSTKKAYSDEPIISKRSFNGDSVLYKIPLYRYVYRGVFAYVGTLVLLNSLFLQGLHLVHAEEVTEETEQKPKIEQVQESVDVSSGEVDKEIKVSEETSDSNEESNTEQDEIDTVIKSSDVTEINPEDSSLPSDEDLVTVEKKDTNTNSGELLVDATVDSSISTTKSSSSQNAVKNNLLSSNSSTTSSSTIKKDIPLSVDKVESYPSTTTISSSSTENATEISNDEINVDETSSASDLVVYDDSAGSESDEELTTVDPNTDVEISDLEQEVNDVTNETNETLNDEEEISMTDSESSDETETVSSSSAPVNHEFVSVTKSDSEITFDKNECTELSNGSFYCYQVIDEGLTDSLFASPDQGGDLEIFLVRDGKQAQLTNNNVDDASPYFDSTTNTIVWHRLVNDRYQIISYNLNTQEEEQLTNNEVNNMEPTKQGKYVVWQRWLNNSWNIVLFDGQKETIITNNSEHNVAPHLQGNLVVWNKHSKDNTRTIEMYNIETGTYVTVNDPDGMTVDNPRMVLIYDSLQPNGEIVTKGYNIFTGEFIKLDTLPRQLPEIPDSESTTEVRALIQPKPEIKYGIEIKNNDNTEDKDEPLENSISTTTTKEISTSTASLVEEEKFDLLLEKDFLSTTSESVIDEDVSASIDVTTTDKDNVDIPDLEIPPFESTSATSSDKNVQ